MGGAGLRHQRWYGRGGPQHERGGGAMERHRRLGGRRQGPLQLLGLEHHRRHSDGAHREREHPHHPRSDPQPAAVVARLQPVRAQLSGLRSHGRFDAALSSRVLFGRRLRTFEMVVSLAFHLDHSSVSCLDVQYHCHRCR